MVIVRAAPGHRFYAANSLILSMKTVKSTEAHMVNLIAAWNTVMSRDFWKVPVDQVLNWIVMDSALSTNVAKGSCLQGNPLVRTRINVLGSLPNTDILWSVEGAMK